MPVMGILYLEARATGLEPATSSVTGKRSNQLSYARISYFLSDLRSYFLSTQDSFQISLFEYIKHHCRDFILPRERYRGQIHHLEPASEHIKRINFLQELGSRVFLGIFLIYAFYIGRLQDRFGTNLGCAQGRRSIGGKIRTAGASRKDDPPPLFQMPERATADKRLAHVRRRNRAHDSRGKATLLKRALERQRIDHSAEHTHIVCGCAVNPDLGQFLPTDKITSSDDHRNLAPERVRRFHFPRNICGRMDIKPRSPFAAQCLARKLEQYALPPKIFVCHKSRSEERRVGK